MMKTRKIALLAAIAVLACVCVLQFALSGPESVREVKLADKPDTIVLDRAPAAPVRIVKDGDAWLIGDKKYPADVAAIEQILSSFETIRVLGTVSASGDYDRYGLADEGRLTVSALKSGKTLRTIAVGKNSVTSRQSYALLDGAKNVSLVSGSLTDAFGKSADELRAKDVWSMDASGITRVEAEGFVIAKTGTPPAWTAVPSGSGKVPALDAEKVGAWVQSLAGLKADSFAAESVATLAKPIAKIVITGAGKTADLAIQETDGESRYLCTSSLIPYPFYISAQTAAKFLKQEKDLAK